MELVLDRCHEGNLLKEQTRETFSDVHNHWAENMIDHMRTLGILSGYADGSFRPDSVMTRAECVTVIVRAFGLRGDAAKTDLLDVAPHAWYADAVQSLYARGIIKGRPDGSFGANKPITREELSLILWRIFNQLDVQLVTRESYDELCVNAKAPMTRAQVVAVINRIFAW